MSELLPIAGIDYLGLLPAEVQQVSIISAAIATKATAPSAAKALIEFSRVACRRGHDHKTGLDPVASLAPAR